MIKRRDFCVSTGLGLLAVGLAPLARGEGVNTLPPVQTIRLPWHCSALAATRSGRVFAALPRRPGYESTPSVVEITAQGEIKPFPGGKWNRWSPGAAVDQALVDVSMVRVVDEHTLWVVDQGRGNAADSDGKILLFDLRTGQMLSSHNLPLDALPAFDPVHGQVEQLAVNRSVRFVPVPRSGVVAEGFGPRMVLPVRAA